MHKKVLNGISNWQPTTPCLDEHQFWNEQLETVREESEVCEQIQQKMPVLSSLWNVN